MKKKVNWSLGLSIGSIIFSIFSVGFCYFRCQPFEEDWMSILVGILSLLVTVLIGVQILNSIGINNKLKEYESLANKSAKGEVDKYSHSVRSYVFSLMTLDLCKRGATEYALDNFMRAIGEGLEGTDVDAINLAIGHMDAMLKKYKPVMVLRGKKKEYISILSKVDDERIDSIIDQIINAAELTP